ncbi:hypothetical protein CPB83DRAFT_901456 [Crepidotus variabilis]|uniref:Uncharacterized protein n=1 Tax=Crepidotus variabilis TaxID=179855 RepID=A0A9P6EUS5_9AGAR|nr:hypothetical protein CPB83DRAFT_901456 [Crepidotus variabilis]
MSTTIPAKREQDDSKAMPPPPIPENKSTQPKILQSEFAALTSCLRDAVVKTGQIYKFHAETRRLGVANQVVSPPSSLTSGLGRDIERYDQLCDSIEAQIVRRSTCATFQFLILIKVRAINVLKRDLRREERRLEEEERGKLAETSMLPPPEPMAEDVVSQLPSDGEATNPRASPTITTSVLGRRPSAISISSLHRPQFPLKLDLSSTSLKFTEEEAMKYQKGLASPVTLAPKSARPTEFPPDFIAAFSGSLPPDMGSGTSNIDLTLSDDPHLPQSHGQMNVNLGDSSDKPIELDMDVDMLFGDPAEASEVNNTNSGLFSPSLPDGNVEQSQKDQQQIMADFNMDSNVNTDSELFGDFSSSQQSTNAESSTNVSSMSFPATLLPSGDIKPSLSTNPSGGGFDLTTIDLTSDFFNDPQSSDMNFPMDSIESFLGVDSAPIVKQEVVD